MRAMVVRRPVFASLLLMAALVPVWACTPTEATAPAPATAASRGTTGLCSRAIGPPR